MSNDNNELKNNAPREEKQEARKFTEEELELTDEELAQVTGGATGGVESFSVEKGFGFIDSEQVHITTDYPISGDDK